MTAPTNTESIVCPSCGASASGRFCATCGATLTGTKCSSCSADLSPGAKFCHRCGNGVGTVANAPPTRASRSNILPWSVAGLAFLALFAMAAGKNFNRSRGATLDAPQNALPQAGLDDRGSAMGAPPPGSTRAPDISNLSPQERADRLFNRVMLLASQGKSDSVQFFAPMAITAYQMLAPLNADQRYDMGRIAEVAGALQVAKAQSDSILRAEPAHLLGLILGARVATLSGDAVAVKSYERRLLAAEKSEPVAKREEYKRHEDDIVNAFTLARRKNGAAP